MKFCTKCGAQLEDAAQFCSTCGAPQNAQPAAPVQPVAPTQTTAPVVPAAPVQPVAPVQPMAPVAPVAPMAPMPPMAPPPAPNKKKNLLIILISVVAAIAMLVGVVFGVRSCASSFDSNYGDDFGAVDYTNFKSEEQMKSAMQGTYSLYDSSGKIKRQIVISGNDATYKWPTIQKDLDSTVREWDYKNGRIHTFEDLYVTADGGLKDGDDVYKRGGVAASYTTTTKSSYGSSYGSSSSATLQISGVSVTSNSSYNVCTGRVTNNGYRTYKFIKVRGAFQNYSGTTLDTDWTYVVGSEGLAPGESSTFRLSVPKDYSISKCTVTIYDYD